ncbi:MAG: hypothetical protein ACPG4X_16825 [Pikeienuella sp.]
MAKMPQRRFDNARARDYVANFAHNLRAQLVQFRTRINNAPGGVIEQDDLVRLHRLARDVHGVWNDIAEVHTDQAKLDAFSQYIKDDLADQKVDIKANYDALKEAADDLEDTIRKAFSLTKTGRITLADAQKTALVGKITAVIQAAD